MAPTYPVLRDADLVVRPATGDLGGAGPDSGDPDELVVRFVVGWRGEVVGLVSLVGHDADDDRPEGSPSVGVLRWDIEQGPSDASLEVRALRLVVDFALAEPGPAAGPVPVAGLGLRRVEARLRADERASVRAALRAGLRREGLLRGGAATVDGPQDLVVLGRLRQDPPADSSDGFTAMLSSTLPTKRAIAQGLIRSPSGEVLVCELTYKREWDLPGGVVDPGESPATCVLREIGEETGLQLTARRLLAVNWLPPYRGWSDAIGFVFDLGTLQPSAVRQATLERREIRALHWVGPDTWAQRVAPYNVRLLTTLESARHDHHPATLYLEDGTLPTA